ncbi:hypothetical protein SLEP1_g24384 [Rubroshorea leprosula]|uniref:Uncharacterized protein n=1 Tax=Rubroshorea leprosula TaxID=152421 RepID=A0AAV5JSS3_9ROSI|nr:hypothetical protein SLEP1_g24384 [Rubroshorea leprosula]
MTSGGWDDLIVNLLSLHELRGKGVVLEILDALEFCSKRNGSLSGCLDFCLPF